MRWRIFLMALAWSLVFASTTWADHASAHHAGSYSSLVKPLLLATLALGYWVLRASRADQGYLRWVGQGTGWLILVASLAGYACSIYHSWYGKHQCPVASKAGHECPHHSSDTRSTLPQEKVKKAIQGSHN